MSTRFVAALSLLLPIAVSACGAEDPGAMGTAPPAQSGGDPGGDPEPETGSSSDNLCLSSPVLPTCYGQCGHLACSKAYPGWCCACDEGCQLRGDCCCDYEQYCTYECTNPAECPDWPKIVPHAYGEPLVAADETDMVYAALRLTAPWNAGGGTLWMDADDDRDFAVASWDENGTHRWSARFHAAAERRAVPTAIEADAQHVYVGGYFGGTMYRNGAAVLSASGDEAVHFLMALKRDTGAVAWTAYPFPDVSYAAGTPTGAWPLVVTGKKVVFARGDTVEGYLRADGRLRFRNGVPFPRITALGAREPKRLFAVRTDWAGPFSGVVGDHHATKLTGDATVKSDQLLFRSTSWTDVAVGLNGQQYYATNPVFRPGSLAVSPYGGISESTIVSLNKRGDYLWQLAVPTVRGNSRTNAAGELYVCGVFSDVRDYGVGSVGTPGNDTALISKLGTDGAHLGQRVVATSGRYGFSCDLAAPADYLFVAGAFDDHINIDGTLYDDGTVGSSPRGAYIDRVDTW